MPDPSSMDVYRWVEEQMRFLDRPGSRQTLTYLAMNAFRTEDNPEEVGEGRVMSGKATVAKIQWGTGLSRRGVFDALRDLQRQGYIIAAMEKGRGKSKIRVYWSAEAHEMRENFRAGIKPLPSAFATPETPSPEVTKEQKEAIILPFRMRD